MTSTTFQIVTVVLDHISNGNFTLVAQALSFESDITAVAQLSRPTSEKSQYAGLLYVPDIKNSCVDTVSSIPRNLTISQLPTLKSLVAFAPSSNCRDRYVAQAVSDGARAIVLYPPDANITPNIPPTSAAYGAAIPVYYATWAAASPIADAMNSYSTDLLNAPHGQTLAEFFPADDYARLLVSVNRSGSGRSLPGLWIFLLIVLGLLCFIVAVTSIAMHTHQYLARRDLRRRIAAGEVDLEGLGIKRLTVPKKFVDAMPSTCWHGKTETEQIGKSDVIAAVTCTTKGTSYDQSSCAICLEDYEPGLSLVRELPCKHIYHEACIDPFLLKRSSLCPLCKQSVLPKGYLPPDALLTSATVMRERRRRRQAMRENRAMTEASEGTNSQNSIVMTNMTRPVANLNDLAPDNEEESRMPARSQAGRIKRLWRALFPT